jgi:hypothetical protein
MACKIVLGIILLIFFSVVQAGQDKRQMVELPAMMQEHMLASMRNHLETINIILEQLAKGNPDEAAEVAEQRLGMSSLDDHGAKHLAKYMPEAMRSTGTGMHRAASRFALKAQEGELLPAYAALQEITAACVACHVAYRIR